MNGNVKLLCLATVFGTLGAAATAAMWRLYDLTLMQNTPPAYSVLACVVVGLLGPLAVGALVWLVTQEARRYRWPAVVGLGIVLAAEVAFYVPIGFIAVAFHQIS